MFKVVDYDNETFYGEDASLKQAQILLSNARNLLHPRTKLKIINMDTQQIVYMEN